MVKLTILAVQILKQSIEKMKILNFILVGVATMFATLAALPFVSNQLSKFFPAKNADGQVIPPAQFPSIGEIFKTPVWRVFAVLGALIGVVLSLFKKNLASILRVSAVGLSIAGLNELAQFLFSVDGLNVAQFLFTVPAGATITQTIQYLPSYLSFDTGAEPAPSLLQVDINGTGLVTNLDQDGVINLNKIAKVGARAGLYQIPLADGTWKSRNGTITITNPGANPLDIFGAGEKDASVIQLNQIDTVLANTGYEFTKFNYLLIPAMAAADKITIDFRDPETGKVFTQDFHRTELLAKSLQEQDEPIYLVDNFAANIVTVRYTPVADRKVYRGSYQSI